MAARRAEARRKVGATGSAAQVVEQGGRVVATNDSQRFVRRFPLPPFAIDALREHKRHQAEARRRFGKVYRKDRDLVFATPEGEHLKPDSITAKVCLPAKKVKLKGVSLHNAAARPRLAAAIRGTTVAGRLETPRTLCHQRHSEHLRRCVDGRRG